MNLYVTPGIIACILSALIGIYVFHKNSKNIQNRVFFSFVLFVAIFSISEVMLRFSSNSGEGLTWGRIGYLGVIFVPLTLLHLSFVFPRERIIFARNKYALFGLYLSGVVILCVFNLKVSVQNVQLSEWGYRVPLSSNFYFIGIWCLIIGTWMIFNFFYSYIQSKTTIERKQVRYVFYGCLIALTLSIWTNIIFPILDFDMLPLATIGLSFFAFFIGTAILKYNLFLFKPMTEPVIEGKKPSPKIYELELGKGYIVKEGQVEQGYEIFIDQITHGISGLCITKYSPQSIRDRYGFEKTPLFWFTFKQSNEELIVNPKKLDIELIPQIDNFVKKGKRTIVYIDCLDQITLVKGFENTLALIKDIENICGENHSILLLLADPNMFDEKQLSVLEKEFLEVK